MALDILLEIRNLDFEIITNQYMALLTRVVRFAFQDIGRNVGMSFMTVFILILMLLSINALWSVEILTGEAVRLVKDQINVSVYFSATATEKQVTEIKNYLKSFPEVVDINMSTRENVLESFRERHRLNPEVLTALDELGDNPFGPTVVVKTKEPGDYQKVITALDLPEYENLIEAKSFDEHREAIDKIQNITNRLETTVLGLSILFAVISFLVIFNTVRVAIQTQRMEIGIKRLVGASNWFIRGPYLVESIIFTFSSMVLASLTLFFALRFIDPYLAVVFPSAFSLTNYYFSHILSIFGVQAMAVLLLTILSSGLAMRRQLKV